MFLKDLSVKSSQTGIGCGISNPVTDRDRTPLEEVELTCYWRKSAHEVPLPLTESKNANIQSSISTGQNDVTLGLILQSSTQVHRAPAD